MGLTAPLGLVALLALALPLAIHFVRRADQHRVEFAATRFLTESRYPRREWQLHQWPLLLLRLLLIACLALLLAMPMWQGQRAPPPPWVVVVPGVTAAAARAAVSGLGPRGRASEWHWLAPGYPAMDISAAAPVAPAALASWIRQLDADLPADTALTLVVPEFLAGLDAEGLLLGRSVAWLVVPGAGVKDAVARAHAASDAAATTDPAGAPPPAAATPPAAAGPVRLAIRYDAAGAAELPVARALAAAWTAAGMSLAVDLARRDIPLADGTAWLIWLGGTLPAEVDAWVRRGGRALASRTSPAGAATVMSDTDGRPWVAERLLGRGRLASTAAPLSLERLPALADPGVAEHLRRVLAAPLIPPDRAAAADVVPIVRTARRPRDLHSLVPAVAVMIALLFLVERSWATRGHPNTRGA